MSDCLFCKIAQRQIPAAIVAETDRVVAFKDINPQAPVHLLVIPKTHVPKVSDLSGHTLPILADLVAAANQLAAQHGLVDDGYRLVINCGPQAGQTVWHLHLHLLGGRPMRWPPG
jgi:histidine triad (HIT) family protein